MTRETFALRCILIALVAWTLFALLGIEVVRHGEPAVLAAFQQSLVNHSSLIAWWLTWSCYMQVLGPIAILLVIIAFVAPAWRTRIIFSIVMLLLCWRGADFLQHFFRRRAATQVTLDRQQRPQFRILRSQQRGLVTGQRGWFAPPLGRQLTR